MENNSNVLIGNCGPVMAPTQPSWHEYYKNESEFSKDLKNVLAYLMSLSRLLVEKGIITEDELEDYLANSKELVMILRKDNIDDDDEFRLEVFRNVLKCRRFEKLFELGK